MKYEHLDCEQAVRNIKQECGRRKGRICNNLKDSYKQEIYNDFYKEYDKYKRAVDKCSSVENLSILEKFVRKNNVKINWYK